MSSERQLIEQAGGEFLGVESGLVWFNEPSTRSTMTLGLPVFDGGGLVVELVRRLMAAKRAEFLVELDYNGKSIAK
jgi:hypothetical protein